MFRVFQVMSVFSVSQCIAVCNAIDCDDLVMEPDNTCKLYKIGFCIKTVSSPGYRLYSRIMLFSLPNGKYSPVVLLLYFYESKIKIFFSGTMCKVYLVPFFKRPNLHGS